MYLVCTRVYYTACERCLSDVNGRARWELAGRLAFVLSYCEVCSKNGVL